ncbi:uncharacterized protein METZ01_LOCUS88940 [marine metagenome]|uniref:Integrin alpha beta-propellor repeat protein n=1 Tax=marine metagenome TaxID=408172 RepID=A0A381V6T7_9ZZZZ
MHNKNTFFPSCVLAVSSLIVGCEERLPQESPEDAGGVAGILSRPITQTHYLKASNTDADDRFGVGGVLEGNAVTLSSDGTTLAVGATMEASSAIGSGGDQDDNAVYGAGAVYVFTRDENQWSQQAYIKASNPGLGDNFGYAIALSENGDTMAVSAHFESSSSTDIDSDGNDDGIPQAGAVYIFVRSGNNWTQEAYVKASNTGEAGQGDAFGDGDQFGTAVALNASGDFLAVGAIGEDSAAAGMNGDESDNSAASAGAIYLFAREEGSWSQQTYVKPSNPGAGDLFGYSVSLDASGNTLAVSSFDEDGSLAGTNDYQDDEIFGTGAVYVFNRESNNWSQVAYLKPANQERNDAFGAALVLSDAGDLLVATSLDEDSMTTGVGSAPTDDWESNTSTGAVYAFTLNEETWSQQAYIKASNSGHEDSFGSRLALSGDGATLAVGAQLEDSNSTGINGDEENDDAQQAGVVYLFARSDDSWLQRAYIKGSNTEAFDEFGGAIALSGDGETLVVGAHGEDSAAKGIGGDQADNSVFDSGAVYVFSHQVQGP